MTESPSRLLDNRTQAIEYIVRIYEKSRKFEHPLMDAVYLLDATVRDQLGEGLTDASEYGRKLIQRVPDDAGQGVINWLGGLAWAFPVTPEGNRRHAAVYQLTKDLIKNKSFL